MSWEELDPPPETLPPGYTGYMAWNRGDPDGKKFIGGDGAWSGDFWTPFGNNAEDAPVAWVPGRGALFMASPGGTVTIGGTATQEVGDMGFINTGSGYTISGGTLDLGTAQRTVLVSAANATITSTLDGTGTAGIIKTGTGTLVINPSAAAGNTFTGNTAINGGTLSVSGLNPLGTSATRGNITFGTGTGTRTLSLAGATLDNNLNLANGTLTIASGTNTLNGNLTLPTAWTADIQSNVTFRVNGVISGGGNINKREPGTLIFAGANTYTGTITVSGGTLEAIGTGALGASASTTTASATGATLRLSGATLSNRIRIGANNLITTSNTTNALSGALVLTANGNNDITVEGATGTLTLSGAISDSSTIGGAVGNIRKMGAGSLILTENALAITRVININAGSLTLNSDSLTNVNYNSTQISGVGKLVKTGEGTITLTGTSGHGGPTDINGGALSITAANNLGSGAVTIGADGTLIVRTATAGAITRDNISGAGTLAVTGPASGGAAGTFTLGGTGAVTLGSVDIENGTLNLTSSITGATSFNVGAFTGAFSVGSPWETSATPKVNGTALTLTIGQFAIIDVLGAGITDPDTYVLFDYGAGGSADIHASVIDDTLGVVHGIPATLVGRIVHDSENNRVVLSVTSRQAEMRTVTFVDHDGTLLADEIKVESGTAVPSISVPTPPTREGFRFTGWNPPVTTLVTTDTTFTAQYARVNTLVLSSVTATADADGNITASLQIGNIPDDEPSLRIGVWVSNGSPVTPYPTSCAAMDVFTTNAAAVINNFAAGQMINAEQDTLHFLVAPCWSTNHEVLTPADGHTAHVRTAIVTAPTIVLPNNPISFTSIAYNPTGTAAGRSNDASINFTVGVPGFNEAAATVEFEFSEFSGAHEIVEGALIRTVNASLGNTITFRIRAAEFAGLLDSIRYTVVVKDAEGWSSEAVTGYIRIGREAPRPLANFTGTPISRGFVLAWDPVTAADFNLGDVALSRVRIWVNTAPVEPGSAPIGIPREVVAASAGGVTISGLEPDTKYWIVAALVDSIAELPAGTLVSPTVVLNDSTPSPAAIGNILDHDSMTIVYEPDSMRFRVVYTAITREEPDPEGLPRDISYRVQIGTATVATVVNSGKSIRGFETNTSFTGDTLYIDVSQFLEASTEFRGVRFDTTYTFFVYTHGPGGVPPISVPVGPFATQTITGNNRESIYFNNNRFSVQASIPPAVSTGDHTVRVVSSNAGILTGFVPFSPGYRVASIIGHPTNESGIYGPLTVRIMPTETIPPGSAPTIYRWTTGDADCGPADAQGGCWTILETTPEVTTSGTFYSATREVPFGGNDIAGVYRLMHNNALFTVSSGAVSLASAQRGGVTFHNAARPVVSAENVMGGVNLIDSFTIRSNIANVSARLFYMSANNVTAFRDTAAYVGSRRGTERRLTYTMRGDSLRASAEFGLLAYLIVCEGSVRCDTINVSRSLHTTGYPAFRPHTPDARKWRPFAVQGHITGVNGQDVSRNAFARRLFDGEEFNENDDTKFLLYRYYRPVDETAFGWVPYATSRNSDFMIRPGRLMWLKTHGAEVFEFDSATTPRLDTMFTFHDQLGNGHWVDFVSPFKFDVTVRDVLRATGGAVDIYKWERGDNGNYSTRRVFVHGVPGFDSDSLRYSDGTLKVLDGRSGAFVAYNSGTATSLRIFPRPAFMADTVKAAAAPALAKRHSGGVAGWFYKVNVATTNEPELTDVMVGYSETGRVLPVSPTFSKEAVVVIDENGMETGHYFTTDLMKSGRTFKLRFINGERQRTTFTFTTEASADVPGTMHVMFVNAATGEPLGGGARHSVSVDGNSHEDVYMIMGTRDYLNKTVTGPSGTKFTVGAISVNQSARSVRVRYYIPFAGVDRVEVAVYSLKGAQLWKTTERVRSASWHTAEWNGRQTRGGKAAAGMYIVRIRAINAKGKTVAIENRRFTFAR